MAKVIKLFCFIALAKSGNPGSIVASCPTVPQVSHWPPDSTTSKPYLHHHSHRRL